MRQRLVWLNAVCMVIRGLSILPLKAQQAQLQFLNGNRPVLDAHNCYPDDGRWADRIDRALWTGFPIGIEQDLAWYVDPKTGEGRVVVSHSAKTNGSEPTLKNYFFDRVRPILERALQENKREQWPLLVLTEDSDAQEEVFYHEVPVGAELRVFGSAHTNVPKTTDEHERIHLLATMPADHLLTERPTDYRRWWNNSWYEVEEGGQPRAGDWTAADADRLKALVDHAHQLGFWIRFYTLDGFAAGTGKGWGAGYNFGSLGAARIRWQACLKAGVNLIATDQYEALAAVMAREGVRGGGRKAASIPNQ